MARTLTLAALLVIASATGTGAQAPGGIQRTVTIIVAGPAFSGGAAQEALVLGVPWTDMAYQLFPRQNVRIRAEYFWTSGKVVPIAEDVRKRGFDFDRAKFLFSSAGFFERPRRVVLVGDLERSDVKRAMYWLRDQLRQIGISVEDEVVNETNVPFFLQRVKADGVLSLRLDG